MDSKLRVGIMGTGRIARSVMGRTLSVMESVSVVAVGSRTREKAEAFAVEYGIARAYGSYEELVSDPDVDLVYITTPHSEHLANIKLCAKAGKHILCEKSLTLNSREAMEAFQAAEENGVMLAEAIWCRYAPMAGVIRDFIASGRLGKIKGVTANLGYAVWDKERVRRLDQGGGALLDVGVYCLNFIDLVLPLSAVTDVSVSWEKDGEYGSDRSESVLLTYEGGASASFYSSVTNLTDRRGVIYGENGYAVVENVNNYSSLTFYGNGRGGDALFHADAPRMITGYEYQFEECRKAILEGRTEVASASSGQSIRIMEMMDRIRRRMGLGFPSEQ